MNGKLLAILTIFAVGLAVVAVSIEAQRGGGSRGGTGSGSGGGDGTDPVPTAPPTGNDNTNANVNGNVPGNTNGNYGNVDVYVDPDTGEITYGADG